MIVDISQTSRTPKYANVTATPNVIAISPYALASSRERLKGEGGREITPEHSRISIKARGHLGIAFPREKDTCMKLLCVAEQIHTLTPTKWFFSGNNNHSYTSTKKKNSSILSFPLLVPLEVAISPREKETSRHSTFALVNATAAVSAGMGRRKVQGL